MSARPSLRENPVADAECASGGAHASERSRQPRLPAAGGEPAERAPTARKPIRARASGRQILKSKIEPNWQLMAIVFGLAGVLIGVVTLHLPDLVTLLLGTAAIGLAAVTPFAVRLEREAIQIAQYRIAFSAAFTALPMLLFGAAVVGWNISDHAVWQDLTGIVVIVGVLAAVILHRNVTNLIVSQAALWLSIAVRLGTWGTFLALVAGICLGSLAAIRQARADNRQERIERDRRRVQVRAEQILNDFEQTGQGWFWETDRRGHIVYLSESIAELLGQDLPMLVGKPLSRLFKATAQADENERTLAFHFSAKSAFTDLAMHAAVTDHERWWAISGRPLHDEFGNFLGFRGSGHDLTEKRRSEAHASRLAHYDSLTGLANRLQMSKRLEKILAAPNLSQRACAVFLLDLDRFKQVNDTMGHPAGDNLLTQVASRLERTVSEYGWVGRLGGDEFQVILPAANARESLAHLAHRIIESLSQPYSIEGHRVSIGASVGIALSPDDGVTAEALIRNADLALYAAKDGGRGRFHFYASDLHSDAEERRKLEQDLRDALAHDGLDLVYQPVVHTTTERITGFEALLRWNHPELGPLSPAKFIPIAEDSGLIVPIGEWALRKACEDLAHLPEQVRVAVNVSPLQFANPALTAVITNALASAGVDPRRLELEINESVFLNDDDATDIMFAALKRIGVRLALDDFGTGFSSLGYLKKAPFDKIKIDQSFVRGATMAGSRNGAIIASIVSLAEALNMETTAEGVETHDELDLVRVLGCSHVQGYIYEKPMTFEQAQARLRNDLTAVVTGYKATRASRQTMLRKVRLSNGGQDYHATIRNVSQTGAMVEGLWNVPPGTLFDIAIGEGVTVTATARWSHDDRMGIEFARPLQVDEKGRPMILRNAADEEQRRAAVNAG